MVNFTKSIPREIGQYKTAEEDKTYNRETIFEYINGGAELYLTYDFREVFARRYEGPENSEIILDIYDMGNDSDAFGIFSIERIGENIGIGEDSEYSGGLLRFWKNKYFVSIVILGDEDTIKRSAFEIARKVDESIKAKSNKPELVNSFLPRGYYQNHVKYFHTFSILTRQYFISDKDILNLSRETNCILARYEDFRLLLIEYPDEDRAQKGYNSFIDNYIPEGKSENAAKTEDGKWTAAKVKKNLLAVIFEAPDKNFALNFLSTIKME